MIQCLCIDNHSRRCSDTKMASMFDNVLVSSFADNGQFETRENDSPRRLQPFLKDSDVLLDIYIGMFTRAVGVIKPCDCI